MADRKLINDYENAVMNLAVSDMLEQFGRELEEKYKDAEDVSPSPEAAEKFEKELNKAYKSGQLRSFRAKAVKFARYAVTVCAAFIVIFAVSVVSVDALRFRFLEWLTNIHGNYTTINNVKTEEKNSNVILAYYMPKGYELINYNNDSSVIELCYSNNTTSIKIHIYLDYFIFNTDNENILLEEVYINENKGQYQIKELTSTLFWYDGEKSYCVSTNDMQITKDELIKIAQSIN